MKKNGFLAIIAMAALSFAACNKEGLPQEGNNTDLPSDESTPVVLEPGVYPATIVAEPIMPDLAGTKAVFDNGAFAWKAGDAIACFQKFEKEYVDAPTNVLTTMWASNEDGDFSGTLPYTGLTDKTTEYAMNFIYPSECVTALSASTYPESVIINLPHEQDGRLSHIGDYFITGAYDVACNAEKEKEGDEVISITPTESVSFSRYFVTCVKVNVPEALSATRLEVSAWVGDSQRNIAGSCNYSLRARQIKGSNSNFNKKSVILQHSDGTDMIGDTYACIMPYVANVTKSSANKLKFKITTVSGKTFTFAKSIESLFDDDDENLSDTEGLQQGTIYDLGTFPTSCVTPKFSLDENGAVVMTSSPAEAKIYYTTDGSDPSAEATLYEGPVEITADTQFKAVAICEGLGNSAVAEELMYGSVVAPVVKIDASGRLTIESIGGHTYKYSISSDGNIPSDPEEDFPTDGLNIATGSHMIKVMATNAAGETAVTNVYYRVVAAVGEQFDLVAGGSNSVAMAPFTITNTSAINYTFKISNSGWYFGGKSGSDAALNILKIQVGLKLQYPSVASLYLKEHADNKKVYLTYKDEDADHSSTTTWGEMWNSGSSCSAGDDFYFRLNNGSILKGFGLLEQGFESFSPAAASVSNEAPVPGQNVAY